MESIRLGQKTFQLYYDAGAPDYDQESRSQLSDPSKKYATACCILLHTTDWRYFATKEEAMTDLFSRSMAEYQKGTPRDNSVPERMRGSFGEPSSFAVGCLSHPDSYDLRQAVDTYVHIMRIDRLLDEELFQALPGAQNFNAAELSMLRGNLLKNKDFISAAVQFSRADREAEEDNSPDRDANLYQGIQAILKADPSILADATAHMPKPTLEQTMADAKTRAAHFAVLPGGKGQDGPDR